MHYTAEMNKVYCVVMNWKMVLYCIVRSKVCEQLISVWLTRTFPAKLKGLLTSKWLNFLNAPGIPGFAKQFRLWNRSDRSQLAFTKHCGDWINKKYSRIICYLSSDFDWSRNCSFIAGYLKIKLTEKSRNQVSNSSWIGHRYVIRKKYPMAF